MTAWQNSDNRTKFIRGILRAITSALGLELESELWKFDFAMSIVSETGVKVPAIFIESENLIGGVVFPSGEVRKLCCHSAPLKILITVGQWDETPRHRPDRSERCIEPQIEYRISHRKVGRVSGGQYV